MRSRSIDFCHAARVQGRYAVYEHDKLLAIMQTTANALVKVGKIRPVELSRIGWRMTSGARGACGMPTWAKIGAAAMLGLAVIVISGCRSYQCNSLRTRPKSLHR